MDRKDLLPVVFFIWLITLFSITMLMINFSIKDLSVRQNENRLRIGAVYMTLNNPFYKVIDDEIRTQVENRGDVLISRNPAMNPAMQNQEILDLLDSGIDLLFVNPVDADQIEPALVAAHKANVPVIAIDTNVANDNLVDSTIVSDNYMAGVQCARHLIETMPEGANIGLLTHSQALSATDRINGFINTISPYSQFHIVAESDCSGQLELAMPAMENLLLQHPEINVVMALNDPAALGAMAALKNNGRLDSVKVYGVDGSPEAKDMIRSGIMTATSGQQPRKIGQLAVHVAYKILNKTPVDKITKLPTVLLSSENLNQFSDVGY